MIGDKQPKIAIRGPTITGKRAVPGRAEARPGTSGEKLESYSPSELNDTGQIVLAAHLADRAAPSGWRIKLRSVEQVEELTSELEPESTVRTELRVLEGREVKVLLPVGAYVGLGTRIGAIAVVIGGTGGEYRSVVPLLNFLGSGTAQQVRVGSSGRTCAAHVGDTGVAESPGAATDDDRIATLERDDRIDAPSANHLVEHGAIITRKRFALPNRQIQNAADDQPLGNIESIQAALSAEVVGVGVSPAWGSRFQPVDFRIGVVDEFSDGVGGKH